MHVWSQYLLWDSRHHRYITCRELWQTSYYTCRELWQTSYYTCRVWQTWFLTAKRVFGHKRHNSLSPAARMRSGMGVPMILWSSFSAKQCCVGDGRLGGGSGEREEEGVGLQGKHSPADDDKMIHVSLLVRHCAEGVLTSLSPGHTADRSRLRCHTESDGDRERLKCIWNYIYIMYISFVLYHFNIEETTLNTQMKIYS